MARPTPDLQLEQTEELVTAFTHVLKGLYALTRFGKALEPEDVVFAVGLLPISVRQHLTKAHLFWAAQQLVLDPEPICDLALPIALLRYLYPCDDGGRTPRFDMGMRPDIRQRMKSDRFVSISPRRDEHIPARQAAAAAFGFQSPATLLQSAPVRPELRTRAQRISHLQRLAVLTGVDNPMQPLLELPNAIEPHHKNGDVLSVLA